MSDLITSVHGKAIAWNQNGVVHAVVGSDVHQDVRLLWTLCEIDVPANAAHLMGSQDRVNCSKCLAAQS